MELVKGFRRLVAVSALAVVAVPYSATVSAGPILLLPCVGFTGAVPGQLEASNPLTCESGQEVDLTYSWRTGDDPQSMLEFDREAPALIDVGDTVTLAMAMQTNFILPVVGFTWDGFIAQELSGQAVGGPQDGVQANLVGPPIGLNFFETFNQNGNLANCTELTPNNTACDDIYTLDDPSATVSLMFGNDGEEGAFFADIGISLRAGDGTFCQPDPGDASKVQCFTREGNPGMSQVFLDYTYIAMRLKDDPPPPPPEVSEPTTLGMLGLGLAGLGVFARRRG